ncbi:MAG: hypothetical protein ACR2HR_17925 [Euzebya sp.]
MDALHRYLLRPPALWQKFAFVVLAVLLPLGLADRRGWAVGVIAAIVYGGLGIAFTFYRVPLLRFSADHRLLDAAFVGPLLFLAVAYLTPLSILLCLGIAVLGCLLLVGFTYLHLHRKSHTPS